MGFWGGCSQDIAAGQAGTNAGQTTARTATSRFTTTTTSMRTSPALAMRWLPAGLPLPASRLSRTTSAKRVCLAHSRHGCFDDGLTRSRQARVARFRQGARCWLRWRRGGQGRQSVLDTMPSLILTTYSLPRPRARTGSTVRRPSATPSSRRRTCTMNSMCRTRVLISTIPTSTAPLSTLSVVGGRVCSYALCIERG